MRLQTLGETFTVQREQRGRKFNGFHGKMFVTAPAYTGPPPKLSEFSYPV